MTDTRWAWPTEQIINAAQQGDPRAIAILLDGSHAHVHRFARTLCSTPEDAEEATQEALIILYQKIGTLRAAAALASWMFQIVRHECIRRSRLALRGPIPSLDERALCRRCRSGPTGSRANRRFDRGATGRSACCSRPARHSGPVWKGHSSDARPQPGRDEVTSAPRPRNAARAAQNVIRSSRLCERR